MTEDKYTVQEVICALYHEGWFNEQWINDAGAAVEKYLKSAQGKDFIRNTMIPHLERTR